MGLAVLWHRPPFGRPCGAYAVAAALLCLGGALGLRHCRPEPQPRPAGQTTPQAEFDAWVEQETDLIVELIQARRRLAREVIAGRRTA